MIFACLKCGGDGLYQRKACVVCDAKGKLASTRAEGKAAGVPHIASEASHEFTLAFEYRGGDVMIDGWADIRPGNETADGKDPTKRYGDCDEFAVTQAMILAGSYARFLWWVLTFRVVFWLAHSPVNQVWWKPRHTILHHKDHGWIDSTERYWRDTPYPHKPRIPMLLPWVLGRLLMGRIYRYM